MARSHAANAPDTATCAVSGCTAVATGCYRMDRNGVVIMVGRPRRKDEIPLCTSHSLSLSTDMVAGRSAS